MGTAHAKVIVGGEHAVVYGYGALALPFAGLSLSAHTRLLSAGAPPSAHEVVLPRSGTPQTLAQHALVAGCVAAESAGSAPLLPERLAVRINGTIPTSRGLGSSAAMSAAVVRAVCDLAGASPNAQALFEAVQRVERYAHGTPSGLDAVTTTADGPVWFEAGVGRPTPGAVPASLVVADTGVRGSTREAVAEVRRRANASNGGAGVALERIGRITHHMREALGAGDDAQLGALMNENHECLRDLGVSHPVLDELVDAAQRAGAMGAKLTGGGHGGCMIALAPSLASVPELREALIAAGAASTWHVRTAQPAPTDMKDIP